MWGDLMYNYNSKLLQAIKNISATIGNVSEGYTHSEIDKMILQMDNKYNLSKDKRQNLTNGLYISGKNKVERIYNFAIYLVQKHNEITAIKKFSEYYLDSGKWLNQLEDYEIKYKEINKALSLVGLKINKNGVLEKTNISETLEEATIKWNSFYSDLIDYNKKLLINSEILMYCDQEAKRDFYYHVLDQICKHLEEKIKKKLKFDENDKSKKAWKLLEERVQISKDKQPYFITSHSTSKELDIDTLHDYQNGYVLFIKVLLKLARNQFAHISRKIGNVSNLCNLQK